MSLSASNRQVVSAVITGVLTSSLMLVGIPDVHADPDTDPAAPAINCDAAGYQRVAAGVALATADYMDAHPDVRDAYSRMKSDNVKPNEEVSIYLESRPEVAAAMGQLRQPLKDLMIRCGWGVPSS